MKEIRARMAFKTTKPSVIGNILARERFTAAVQSGSSLGQNDPYPASVFHTQASSF